jgi:nucleotide-binding universal stress UspA family protein
VGFNIVVGIDGSENARRALSWAVDEALLRDADLIAVFAWQLPLIGVPGAFDREELEQESKRFINGQIAAVDPPADVRITPLVAQGDPTASLLAACENARADLLVLGSRGREGFVGLMLGSVGQQCASYAPCPVMIVKPLTYVETLTLQD